MANGPHILIVEARFYEDIADELFEGARAVIEAAGGTFERVQVPGVFEIPAAVAMGRKKRGKSQRAFDGFVALGCVIRGETSHYDVVANESARGLTDLSVKHELAVGNGILTVDTKAQADVRASRYGRDKGGDAARACVAMVELKRKLNSSKSK